MFKASPPPANTLAGNSRIPAAEIRELFQKPQWRNIQGLTYTGYVVMEGRVLSDEKVKIGRISESWPDHSRDLMAQALASRITVPASTTGSNLSPKVEVYVIFYENMLEGNLAVIFARQTDLATAGSTGVARSLTSLIY